MQDAAAQIAAQPSKPSPVANGPWKGTAPAIAQAVVEIAASPAAHPLPGELQDCMLMPWAAAQCTELAWLLLLLAQHRTGIEMRHVS